MISVKLYVKSELLNYFFKLFFFENRYFADLA